MTGRIASSPGCKQLPDLADVATDQQTGASAVSLMIDRVTASRLGVAPGTMDNTLYDAFGQRQISTMYTQLNQYHVILEALPPFQQDPNQLNKLYIQSGASNGASGPGAATSFAASGSSSAGSNATTGSVLYTPAANTLAPPSQVITTSNNGPGSNTRDFNDSGKRGASRRVCSLRTDHRSRSRSSIRGSFRRLRSPSTWRPRRRWEMRSRRSTRSRRI